MPTSARRRPRGGACIRPIVRFTDRVADYVRFRPGYPAQIITQLRSDGVLFEGAVVADIGSGTGLLAQPFLDAGQRVIGVEPNDAMREAGDERLQHEPAFTSHGGTAEATFLPDQSVDLVVAGQAFHWFDQQRAKREFRRILKPGGGVALVWSERIHDASEFLRGYEALLSAHCPEYAHHIRTHFVRAELESFFAPEEMRSATFRSEQVFAWDGLVGRVRSSSYVPRRGAAHAALLQELRVLFDRHAQRERIAFVYSTQLLYAARFG